MTSRWTSPCSCAKASARAICSASRTASSSGSGACALDERLQVLAVDVLEDDELAAVLLAAVDHRDDVRMRELGDRARLAAEALDVLVVVGELLVQHLQRDVALEQPVVRPVDARHAAGADELLELVALRDQLPDHNAQLCPRSARR